MTQLLGKFGEEIMYICFLKLPVDDAYFPTTYLTNQRLAYFMRVFMGKKLFSEAKGRWFDSSQPHQSDQLLQKVSPAVEGYQSDYRD